MIELQEYADKYTALNQQINDLVIKVQTKGKFDPVHFFSIINLNVNLNTDIAEKQNEKLLNIYHKVNKYKIDHFQPVKLGWSYYGQDYFFNSNKDLSKIIDLLDVMKLNGKIFSKVNINELNKIKQKENKPLIDLENFKNDSNLSALGNNSKIKINNIDFIFLQYQGKLLIDRMLYYHLDQFDKQMCEKIIKLTEIIYDYNKNTYKKVYELLKNV